MTAFDPEKITFFAKTDARGQDVTFGIKAKDRQRHMYVVGKTGMGKSTLLENMAAQDIQNGEGMAFIDPHGSAAETLLDYVPEHRVKDVIYFAPFDTDYPISFNVMEDVGADKRHLVVSGLMSTFKKIWVDAWSARMEYILTNALLVLIEYPDTTLLSVNRLFIDKAYREKVVEYCKDPAVKSFWTEEFANYTDRFAAEALPAIQNKIGQFTGNPLIRNIIGQPHSSFDIRKIMDEKKILIMNLSKGLIGETNANLLGSMLTTRIYLAAMSRADLPVEQMKQMPNFYFYVDEFQSFANATFANILSEARKYHLNLIIAHQYIAQMEEEVRDAVFGNVGTTVSFRVGPFDAEVLETVFTPRFLAADMVNLGFAQIYLTLMIDGIGSQPFSATTLPPVQRPPVSCKHMVIESSRQLYAGNRAEVEKVVADLHTPQAPEPKGKPNNGGGNASQKSNTQGASAQTGKERFSRPEKSATQPSAKQLPSDTKTLSDVLKEATNQVQAPEKPTQPKNELPTKSGQTETSSPASTSAPTAVPNRSAERSAKKPTSKPAPKQVTKPAVKTPDDLRAVLAKMTQQTSSANKSTNSVSVSVESKQSPQQQTAKSPSARVADTTKPIVTGDLKNALAGILEKVNRPAAPTRQLNDDKASGSQVPAQSAPQAQPISQPAPAQPPKPQNTNLHPADIKRMLRQSDQERSPFV